MHFPKKPESNLASQPIGVFDSGIGGLTVVRALRELLPEEDIFYLGDTARLPYGGKDRATIERYSLEIAGLLLAENVKMIVVACNTASALALPRLQQVLRIPVMGVIVPGARAAIEKTRIGKIGVLATRATVASAAYERAIAAFEAGVEVISQACPLLVPLIEEAWLDDPVTREVLERYLGPLLAAGVDTLVLGCTHYPLLEPLIAEVAGPEVTLVDSAFNCAAAVRHALHEKGLRNRGAGPGRVQVALTDTFTPFLKTAEAALRLRIDHLESRVVQGVTMLPPLTAAVGS
ncbi:MAG: glutamate racemase [Verrucomicrobia bacterium]|nr:glutamate racemase [Verrucomicrobiota bacterium]